MIYQWKELTPEHTVLLRGLGGEQGVWVRPTIVRALGGDGNGAIILQHMMYWCQTEMAEERDGWFYLTTQKLQRETGLSYDIQERVRRKLVALGVLDQKRDGIPARNYYRLHLDKIVELLIASENKYREMSSSRSGDSPHQDEGNAPIIENKENNPIEKKGINRPGQIPGRYHVLGDKAHTFINWIVETYPVNTLGIGATENQAMRISKKLGELPLGALPEEINASQAKVQELIRGIKNFRTAVDSGAYNRMYVPKFEKFAGLGVSYGKEPDYKLWAAQRKPPEERRLII